MAKKMEKQKDVAPRKVRWAFIGCGRISQAHLSALQQMPQVEIVAGCDILEERLEWFHQQPGCEGAYLYQDYRDMLASEEIDAVDVCTPNDVHCPAAIAALKAGCHVIVEKPMAMSPEECRKMIAASKKAGRLLAVGFQIRYTPEVEMCVKARKEGLLGEILYGKVHAMRRRGVPNWGVFGQKEKQGGGPMIDIGVHMIESCLYAMGEPKPVAASGMTWTYLGNQPSDIACKWPGWDWKTYNVEDLAVGQVRFDNGAILQIESSFCAHIKEDMAYWEVYGTKGGFDMREATLYHDQAGVMVDSKASFLPDHTWPKDFVSKLGNFTDAIQYGTPLRAPGEAGLAVQSIIDAIYRSAAQGGVEVKIP